MMWLVEIALRRPISIAVMALIMLVLGALSFSMMNIDIFPTIDIPVVIALYNYTGLSAVDMERRVITQEERGFSTTVNGIDHIESFAVTGTGLIKVYFQPGVSIPSAIAQMVSTSTSSMVFMPRGMEPPNILDYNAANVPIAHLNVSSDTVPENKLFDYSLYYIRTKLFTVPGTSIPPPLGGVPRSIMVNLDPQAMFANGLGAADIGEALAQSNVIIPSGTVRMGDKEFDVNLNMSPAEVKNFNRLPIKLVPGLKGPTPVFLGDVASVTDSHQPQTNVVRVNGKRATFLLVIKHAAASTLGVINGVKRMLPEIQATAPKGFRIKLTFDQSVFVRAALWDVVQEALIAAALVALMVLVFLGSARSMVIVVISIPLSILTAIVGLKLSGQTINTMTLGGLALAVGMLVDDATVEVENIHRNHMMGKPLLVAILDGASQIATPTLVGTLAIIIVFFPVVLLQGVARFLFTPLALAVTYAMLTSYLLSRTLVTTMAASLLPEEATEHVTGPWSRFHAAFNRGFDRMRERYRAWLAGFIAARRVWLCYSLVAIGASMVLFGVVGEDFFPQVDAGMMKLHVRVPTGTRIEQTERIVDAVEHAIPTVIPARDITDVTDNIGLPFAIELAFFQTDNVGPQDAEINIQLRRGHQLPTAVCETRIRRMLAERFPEVRGWFQAADIINQVLNFGLPAPINVQLGGMNMASNYALARKLEAKMARIPGITDLRIAEPLDYPAIDVHVDRARALEMGITMQQVASSLLTTLSGDTLLQPNFWLDPISQASYFVISQAPQHLIDSVDALGNMPLGSSSGQPQLLSNVATFSRSVDPAVIDHYTIDRVINVNAGVAGRDLGGTTADVRKAIASLGRLPVGSHITIRGQSEAMAESFGTMELGLILAVVLVYLLMAANFQSWLEPLIILMAVPGALAGVLWMLVLTHTTINVESLMGTIMAVGVGVANGNLLITFANDLREEGYSATAAAIEAGRIRLRPILMTALAMILGMLPMALAWGEGSEQNAPLGRAVIGGLLGATLTTLFVVPAVYSIFSRAMVTKQERDDRVRSALMPRV
ncbi:MAG TPA: efflux RND transporter permease subunit [Candidatus Binataceae bacterium]|nr:efflux RND transporter permease subunit [Candidatus Binataceae bacterium]